MHLPKPHSPRIPLFRVPLFSGHPALAIFLGFLALFNSYPASADPLPPPGNPPNESLPNGSLEAYVAHALRDNPQLLAFQQRWEAATLDRKQAWKLPEPTFQYDYYLSSVETRVGPQRHRLGLSQDFPWPGKLKAAAAAAADKARASGKAYEAQQLAIRLGVAERYWRVWLLREEHRLGTEHDFVLESLAGAVRGRVQTGDASLADLNQVELGISRHHDHKGKHHEANRAAIAQLLFFIGQDTDLPHHPEIRLTDTPSAGLPTATEAELLQAARNHPRVTRYTALAKANEHLARKKDADRMPGLQLGVHLIETGPSLNPQVKDSGKDAWILSAGLRIPIWWNAYDAAKNAELARSAANQAEHQNAVWQSAAELITTLGQVRDAHRRIKLCQNTLIPQAETTFYAVLGSYQTGRSTVATALLAQRELLELRLTLVRAYADHARSWARLEYVAGQTLTTGPA